MFTEICLKHHINAARIPAHVAIIMDGNRRWARLKGKAFSEGHKQGTEVLTNTVKISLALGIKVLTVFAFSTENWARSSKEVTDLMELFQIYLLSQRDFLLQEGVRLRTIGDLTRFSPSIRELLQETCQLTAQGTRMDLVLALNYGARDEIRRAVVKLLEDYDKGVITKESITEKMIASYLDTAPWADPDLLIRTSGELRLSNFLLWQLSYSEVFVMDVLWPDFSEEHFFQAIHEYQQRKRRGGI